MARPTCTSAHCDQSTTCNGESAQLLKKRKRWQSTTEDSGSCKVHKSFEQRIQPLQHNSHDAESSGQRKRLCSSASRRGGRDTRDGSDCFIEESLPTPSRSGSTSQNATPTLDSHDCTQLPGHENTCTLTSPTSLGECPLSKDDEPANNTNMEHDGRKRSTRHSPYCGKVIRPCVDSIELAEALDTVEDATNKAPARQGSNNGGSPRGSTPHVLLGPSIPPPSNPMTPPEWATHDSYDPDFLERFLSAYRMSEYSEALLRRKYGEHITAECRRGLTPEETRKEWETRTEKLRAYADTYSDSD